MIVSLLYPLPLIRGVGTKCKAKLDNFSSLFIASIPVNELK